MVARPSQSEKNYVQVYGSKKTAKAICLIKAKSPNSQHSAIRVNSKPLALMTDSNMILKFQDALSIVKPYLDSVKISIKTSGGGVTSKIYAVRQAICRGILSWVGKNSSED